MHIGIVSDIHDNIWALREALAALRECDALLCLGDLCAPFTLLQIAESFVGDIHVVWGNNDGDKLHIARSTERFAHVKIHGEFAQLELEGCAIALTHYPDLGEALAQCGRYDLVCHGHDHERRVAHVGATLLVNPGEVMGRFGMRSVAIYDTETHAAEVMEF